MHILVGTHGVGKSTLLKEIEKHGRFVVMDGYSRPLHKALGSESNIILQRTINEITSWAFEQYQDQKIVSGRSPIDIWIYSQAMNYPMIPDRELKRFLEIERFSQNKSTDRIFYIPIEFEMEKDDVRPEDEELRRSIDEMFVRFLHDFKLPYITLTGTVEQRYKLFDEATR